MSAANPRTVNIITRANTMMFLLALTSTFLGNSSPAIAQEDQTPLYLTLDAPPAPVLTAQEELATFRIAPGFHLELVASEPLIEDPVSIKWDEKGNLYVVEMRGFMPDAYGNGQEQPIGSIVRLRDSDNDGQMDSREVILDSLVLPRAIAIVAEGLLIAEPPNLWLCPSELNNAESIDCSRKLSLGEYGNQPGSVEHAENALLLALDNWIYNAKSDRKMRIRNNSLEVQPTVFRGQWALTQDDDGYLYYNSNSNLITGDLYADEDVVRAGVDTAPGLQQRLHRGDRVFSIRVNPGVNRAYLDGVLREDGRLRSPTAASGVEIYRGDQFPSEYYGSAFVPESAGNLVAHLQVNKDDLALTTTHSTFDDPDWGQRDFLASTDERFRPVEIKSGPDGALYVVDMYRGIIQDFVFLTDELRAQVFERDLDRPLGMGRIWRVVHSDSTIDYGAEPIAHEDPQQLVGLLSHSNAWYRDTAQRMLVASEDSRTDAALREALATGSENSRVHSLWALQGRERLNVDDVLPLLTGGSERLVQHALRAGCQQLDDNALIQLVERPSGLSNSSLQAALFCMSHHYSDRIFDFLSSNADRLIEDDYLRVGLQTASFNEEYRLLQYLVARGRAAAVDADTRIENNPQLATFVEALIKQFLGNESVDRTAIADLLDPISERGSLLGHDAIVLNGIYAATHTSGFERVELTAPHPLFEEVESSELSSAQRLIADVRRAFTWPGDNLSTDQKPLDANAQRLMQRGAELYAANCSSCHGIDGGGAVGLAPPLQRSNRIAQAPEQVLRIILQGLSGPIEVAGQSWNGDMPGMAMLPGFDDEGISGLATYLRRSFGNNGSPISPETVAAVREQTAARSTQWSDAELAEVDVNLHYRAYEGYFGGFQFVYNGRELEVYTSVASGPMEEIREDVFFFADRGYNVEFDRPIEGVSPSLWTLRDGVKVQVQRRSDR